METTAPHSSKRPTSVKLDQETQLHRRIQTSIQAVRRSLPVEFLKQGDRFILAQEKALDSICRVFGACHHRAQFQAMVQWKVGVGPVGDQDTRTEPS